jgi:3-oxoacyl-[acyl-carrier-protein] synthase III
MRCDDARRLNAQVRRFPALGIEAGTRYLPPHRKHLRDWARTVGMPGRALLPSMADNGLAYFHVAPKMDVESLSVAAVERLIDSSGLRPQDVDVVIFCHTNTTSVMAAPSSVPALLARRFGMQQALCYSISQQSCASVMCAVRVLRTLLWRHPQMRNAVIVSTDKVFGERFRNVSNYAIQSDGSMALWLSRDGPRNRLGHLAYHVDAAYFRGADKGGELTQRFALNYPLLAHRMMAEVMAREGWSPDAVDAVLPMNANLTAFSRVMDMLGLPRNKLHSENIGAVGHMFSCDPFLNFIDRFSDPALVHSGNAVLFASASTGVFCALGIRDSWTGAPQHCPWTGAGRCDRVAPACDSRPSTASQVPAPSHHAEPTRALVNGDPA